MRRFSLAALAVAATVGGCSDFVQGPALAGYPGLSWQIESYYSARAREQNAFCTTPRKTQTQVQVVEDTPTRLVLNVRYRYWNDLAFGTQVFPYDVNGFDRCTGWATRTFVVAKSVGGEPGGAQALSVTSMTGPQRQLPPGSALG